jgi:protein ImuB
VAEPAGAPERMGCLLVPELPLAALLRAEPERVGAALAVADGPGPRACLLAATPAARVAGAAPGQRVAQARSLAPGLEIRPVSPGLVRSAQAALLDVARAFSPRVAWLAGGAPDGAVLLGLGGLERLFGDERRLAQALEQAASRAGLDARAGVASTPVLAHLAARLGVGVVRPGEERAFLEPLPVGLLDPSPALRTQLERFGLERLGELARLPAQGLGRRLGPEGLRLWRLARGEEPERRLQADPEPERFVEEDEPGWPLAQLAPLLEALRPLLARLAERLGFRGLAAGRLRLELRLEGHGRDARELELAAPTRRVSTWLELARLSLERAPPRAGVEALRVEAEPAAARRAQLDLFAPAGPAGSRLDEALARLAAVAGAGRVGAAEVRDEHRPEAVAVVPFGRPPGPGAAVTPEPGVAPLPLRALRPAEPVEVERDVAALGVRLRALWGARLRGQVRAQAGPYRLAGGWWEEAPLGRDYYDVELSDGGVYRLYREHATGAWFVDGMAG